MFFGDLAYDVNHSGSITLGTNGIASLSASNGLALSGTEAAGGVNITATTTDVIEIRCVDSTILSNGNNKMDLTNIEVAINNGVSFGNAAACTGTQTKNAPSIVYDMASGNTPILLVGGRLVIPTNGLESGTYNGQGGGGSKPVAISVVFQ